MNRVNVLTGRQLIVHFIITVTSPVFTNCCLFIFLFHFMPPLSFLRIRTLEPNKSVRSAITYNTCTLFAKPRSNCLHYVDLTYLIHSSMLFLLMSFSILTSKTDLFLAFINSTTLQFDVLPTKSAGR